jgi:hypothetical protein
MFGLRPIVPEGIIRLQEGAKPPAEIDLMVTVCGGNHRNSEPVRAPNQATWDQVLTAWRIQAIAKNPDAERYPAIDAAYVLKTETGDPITSMDGISRVFAHFLPTMVSQLA